MPLEPQINNSQYQNTLRYDPAFIVTVLGTGTEYRPASHYLTPFAPLTFIHSTHTWDYLYNINFTIYTVSIAPWRPLASDCHASTPFYQATLATVFASNVWIDIGLSSLHLDICFLLYGTNYFYRWYTKCVPTNGRLSLTNILFPLDSKL
jgi:hypothetical protein